MGRWSGIGGRWFSNMLTFDYVENSFIRKTRLISKFMTSQPGEKTFAIHILLNILRNKGNQTIKFGQLIETFFLKSHTQIAVEKLFPDFLLKGQIWVCLRINKWLQLDSNPIWPNEWVFVYELSGSRFESGCSHLNFRFCTCFKQGVSWHCNYRVWIHSVTRTWHDKNIQPGSIF